MSTETGLPSLCTRLCLIVQTWRHTNINEYTKFGRIYNLVNFCQLVSKISSGNDILTSIKNHNSVTNLRKQTGNNPNLDRVNFNADIKFGQILSICSPDIEWKRNSDIHQGP